jgi:hypothetical protein
MERFNGTGYDRRGHNNHLTGHNTVGYSLDVKQGSYSADFELSNTAYLYIEDENQTGLDITGDLSLVAWLRPETVDGFIMSKFAADGDQRAYAMRVSGGAAGDLSFLASSDGITYTIAYTPRDLVSSDFWYHAAAVYNGQDLRIYLDGQLQENGRFNPKEYSSGIYDSTAQFRLGSRDGASSHFDGLLDEAAVFNRELTPWEIANIRENGVMNSGLLARLMDRFARLAN